MRKIFIGLGILVIVLIIGVLAVAALIDVNRYRPQIESKLRDRLERNVSLGEMRLSWMPPAFRVDDVVIDEDPSFASGRPFMEVKQLFVRPRLLPLFRNEIQIASVQLQRPRIELVRNEEGVWNYSSLEQRGQHEPRAFSLDRFKIYDGRVGITDRQERKPRTVYEHIDAVLTDFGPDRSFYVDARAHVPGSDGQTIVLSGNAGPVRDGLKGTPFDGKLKLDGVSLAGLRHFANVQALTDSDAILTGDANVKNKDGVIVSSGKFQAKDVRINKTAIGYPIAVDYDVSGNVQSSTTQIRKANLKLGQTPVSVEGLIGTQSKPATIDLKVHAANASIAEAARLAAALGVAFNPGVDVNGAMNLNVHATGPANRPIVEGQIAARDVRMSGGDLREPVQAAAIELSLSRDAIRSNEFTAATGRTAVTTQFAVFNYAADSPQIEAKLSTNNAELGELLRIAHAYGVSVVDGMKGSGSVTLNAAATGPLKQADKLMLSGSGALRNASITSPSLAKPVEVRNADIRFTANSVVFDNLDCSLGQTVARGNLTARNFSAPQVEFALAANMINLAEWQDIMSPKPLPQGEVGPKGLLTRTSGSGRLNVDTVIYDKLTLSNMHSAVTLDHGIITMKPLTAGIYKGQQVGSVVMNARSRPITYTVDAKLQGVDANELLSSISPVKQTLYGLLSADADVHFLTSTANAADIVRTLDGKVSLVLKDGKIANMDVLHQLATIGKFARTAHTVEPFTQVIQMTGDFDIHDGVARTNNLKAAIDAGSFAAEGVVDLPQQKINMRLTAVLSSDYSQSVGGPNIGGFLNTALANEKGELVIPVIVSGTLQNPQFAPDLQKVAQMKLQRILPTANNPFRPTIGILGDLLRGQPGKTEAKPATPEKTLEDIFDIFGARKKPEK